MTRRRLLMFGFLVMLVMLGVGVWLLLPTTAITRENAAKIQEGMTLAEVEAILGGPARSEADGYGHAYRIDIESPSHRERNQKDHKATSSKDMGVATYRWTSAERKVEVDVNADLNVLSFWSGFPLEPPLLDRIRCWLRL